MRDWDIGSNPHSNGEAFSRFLNDFFEIKKFVNKIKKDKIIKIIDISNKNKIIYIKFKINFFNWKLNVFLYTI